MKKISFSRRAPVVLRLARPPPPPPPLPPPRPPSPPSRSRSPPSRKLDPGGERRPESLGGITRMTQISSKKHDDRSPSLAMSSPLASGARRVHSLDKPRSAVATPPLSMPTMKDFEGTWLPFDSADHRSFVIKHGFINDCNSVRVDDWHLEVRAGRDDQGTLFTERAALTQSGTQLRWTHGPIWVRQGHLSDDMRSDLPLLRARHGSQNSHRDRSRTADDRPVDSLKPPSPGQSLQPDVCQSPGCQFLMPSDEKKVCELHCCKKCRACPGTWQALPGDCLAISAVGVQPWHAACISRPCGHRADRPAWHLSVDHPE